MKSISLILLCFLLSLYAVHINAHSLDSLKLAFTNHQKEDTIKATILVELIDYYSDNYLDSSLFYIQKLETLSKKLKTTNYDFQINTAYAEYYLNKDNYPATILHLQKCKQIASQKNDKFLLSKVLNNLSATYSKFGQNRFAIEQALESLNIAIEINDTINLSNRYATISRIYNDLSEYEKSIANGKLGIKYGIRYKHINGTIISYNNVAASYASLFKMDSANYYQLHALKLARQYENVFYIFASLTNLSFNDYALGKFENIPSYYKQLSELIELYELKEDNTILIYQKIIKSIEYITLNKLDYAKAELIQGIQIAKSVRNDDAIENAYDLLSKVEYLRHDIPSAEYYKFKKDSITRLIFANELNNFALDLETKYQTQKNENKILKQNNQIKKRNLWLIILFSSLVFISISAFWFNRYIKQKNKILEKEKIIHQKKIIELEKEKQLQATEAILKGQENERSRIAKDLHDGLGGLLSSVKYSLNDMKENVILSADTAASFTRSIDMLDSGIQELRRIAHNMMPESLVKFGLDAALNDYCNAITKTNVLHIQYSSLQMETYSSDINVSITIYRIIQELINNTIKHAKASEVIVQLSKDENFLHITVEDNGIGFNSGDLNNFKGAGWTNIQNRINYLKGRLDLDSNINEGTSVNIEIPLA